MRKILDISVWQVDVHTYAHAHKHIHTFTHTHFFFLNKQPKIRSPGKTAAMLEEKALLKINWLM